MAVDRTVVNYHRLQMQLASLPWYSLAQVNWPNDYPYRPLVNFQIAHDNQHIFIHFSVEEKFVKAQHVRSNEAVYEDSCVEFFISFDAGAHYYNLEFNVLGTGLIAYGSTIRAERTRLSAERIEEVAVATTVTSQAGAKSWGSIWTIPIAVFEYTAIASLQGLSVHGNFYKCGDTLPEPHFLSWAAIESPKPNFHLPEFFAEIGFE